MNYTNGKAEQEFESIRAAAKALRAEYPRCAIYDAGGFKRLAGDTDRQYDIRNGRAALVWLSEAESRNDDGGKAIASINVE